LLDELDNDDDVNMKLFKTPSPIKSYKADSKIRDLKQMGSSSISKSRSINDRPFLVVNPTHIQSNVQFTA
jgi:hypothetical protein